MTTFRLVLTLATTLFAWIAAAQTGTDAPTPAVGSGSPPSNAVRNPWAGAQRNGGNAGPWGGGFGNSSQNPWQNGRQWPAYGRRWPSPWGWQRSGSTPTTPNQQAWEEPTKIECGFVFIDGKEIEPPFELTRKDGKILVNGHEVCESLTKEQAEKRMDGIPWGAMGRGPLLNEIHTNLVDGGMVIVAGGTHYVIPAEATVEALGILTSDRSRKSKLKKLGKVFEDDQPDIAWEPIVAGFQPSDGLKERLDRAASILHSSSGRFRRTRRVLLVSGLALAILALGFLVLYRPASHGQSRAPALLARTVLVSIVLLLAMNVYDLVATVHSCIPGALMEVNWLAQPLVRKPVVIALTKLGAVGFGCFAIWWFRERKIASFAAWWLGLAYTVLTFHWAVCQYILLV